MINILKLLCVITSFNYLFLFSLLFTELTAKYKWLCSPGHIFFVYYKVYLILWTSGYILQTQCWGGIRHSHFLHVEFEVFEWQVQMKSLKGHQIHAIYFFSKSIVLLEVMNLIHHDQTYFKTSILWHYSYLSKHSIKHTKDC